MTKAIKKDKPLVFIVEDNQAYRMLIGRVLEQRGFLVMMFEHGRKAMDMLNYIQPSLILSDIAMPCMDGFELYSKVKEYYPKLRIPFVYLSSSTCPKDIDKATKIGASRMLGKPISPDDLAQTLDTVLKEVA
jgi:CheY-like chemotaxis protein